MRVVTVHDFRDPATEWLASDGIVFITQDDMPAGFFVPWAAPDLPEEVRKTVFERLARRIRQERAAQGVDEGEILEDFATWRRRR